MPYELDETDILIIKSLIQDGRKSFRQISRELHISTPTIKFRFQRLVDIGLIKSIIPILDLSKLEKNSQIKLEKCNCETEMPQVNLSSGMSVKMTCEYCDGIIASKPHTLKFANIERFFCCTSCKSLYKEKYRGRIESLIKKTQNT